MYLLSRSLLGRADTRIRTPLPAPASLVRFVSRYTARLGAGQESTLQAMLVEAPALTTVWSGPVTTGLLTTLTSFSASIGVP